MALLVKLLMVVALLTGSLSGLANAEDRLAQQIQKLETTQARLCGELQFCDENPIANMIQTMKAAQVQLKEYAGEDVEPLGPNGPYACSLICEADDEGCAPCEANGPLGTGEPAGIPVGPGVAAGPGVPAGEPGPHAVAKGK